MKIRQIKFTSSLFAVRRCPERIFAVRRLSERNENTSTAFVSLPLLSDNSGHFNICQTAIMNDDTDDVTFIVT